MSSSELAPVRTLARRVLEHGGHEVVEAGDGREALAAYRGRPADLVLCDMWMPGMDGLELLRALRREFPGVRFVAMSGGGIGGHDALPTALELGAAEVLSKPFASAELRAVVERALAGLPTEENPPPAEGEAGK